jgi:hypothetical protein
MQDELFLGAEVAVDGAGRDLGGLGDLLDRDRVEAALIEQVERDLLDAPHCCDPLAVAKAGCAAHRTERSGNRPI